MVYFKNVYICITETVRKHSNATIYCAGDFNLPDIDWRNESIVGHRYSYVINVEALNLMHESGFVQLVDSPTQSGNILDLFFTNKPSLVQKCHVVSGISDHEIVMVATETMTLRQPSKSHKIYLWNNVNLSDMRDNMNNFTEEFCHQYTVETSVENLWVCLRNKLHDLLKHFVPHKNLRNNHQQPWITYDIKHFRRRKRLAYNPAKATKSSVHW